MPTFRRKELHVEAIQFTGDNFKELHDWAGDSVEQQGSGDVVTIYGRENASPHTLALGDWLVQDVEGYFYACTDSLFKKIYESA